MSINSRCGRTDTAVRAGIAARLAEIKARVAAALDGPWDWGDELAFPDGVRPPWVFAYGWSGYPVDDAIEHRLPATNADAEFIASARADVPALTNAVESVLDYVARCEESGITMQPGDVRRLIAAALGGAS